MPDAKGDDGDPLGGHRFFFAGFWKVPLWLAVVLAGILAGFGMD